MKEQPIGWLYELEEKLHPDRISFEEESLSDLMKLIESLKKQGKAFRTHFIGQLGQSRKQAKISLMQVIYTSNTIYNYLTINKKVKRYRSTGKMQYLYSQILALLELLLEDCSKFDKNMVSSLPLTAYSITNTRMRLRQKLDKLRLKIGTVAIDTELGNLIISGLQLLNARKELNRATVEYALLLMDRLESLTPLSTVEVENLLYQYDFNTPAFFSYSVECCTAQLADTSSLHTQLEILIGLEDRINGLPARTSLKWMPEDASIRKQLRTFYKEKKTYIQQRIDLRRAEIRDMELAEEVDRAQVNLPVAQFGLLIRLMIEKGIMPKDDVGKTFAHYARHFRTPKTPFISAESLQKKSTDVEYATAKKMKGHLIGMVNWLNENHNTQRDKDLTP